MSKMTLADFWANTGEAKEAASKPKHSRAQERGATTVAAGEQDVRYWYKATGGKPRFPSEKEAPLYHQVVKFLDKTKRPITEELRSKAIEDGRKRAASPTVMARIAQGKNRTVTRDLNRYRANDFALMWSNPMMVNPYSIGCIPADFPTVDSSTRPQVVATLAQQINNFAKDLEAAKDIIDGLDLPAKKGPLVSLPELLEMIADGEATLSVLPYWVAEGEKNLTEARTFMRNVVDRL